MAKTLQEIAFTDFMKVDMRIGQVLAVEVPEWSEKLLQLTVDFGEEIGQRTIFSGIKAYYQVEDLLNHKFPFVVNLAPRKMGPSVSQGMMLMVDAADKPLLIPIADEVVVGAPLA